MITKYNIRYAKEFCCEPIENILGYEECKNSPERIVIHHLNEIILGLTPDELKSKGLYYKRPACELQFMTRKEHTSLHFKGKKMSQEQKDKIGKSNSIALTGRKNGPPSDATKDKIREANIGKKRSLETCINVGLSKKDCHWYNDGVKSYLCKECPPNCNPGRIIDKKQ